MPRKQKDSFLADLFGLLKVTPIWVGPVLALLAFVALRFLPPLLIPAKAGGPDVGIVLRPLLQMFAWIVAAVVLLLWVAAETYKLWRGRLLERQSGIESIRDLS